jgi:hypothetical protein
MVAFTSCSKDDEFDNDLILGKWVLTNISSYNVHTEFIATFYQNGVVIVNGKEYSYKTNGNTIVLGNGFNLSVRYLYLGEIEWEKDYIAQKVKNWIGPGVNDFVEDSMILLEKRAEFLEESMLSSGELKGNLKVDTRLSIELSTLHGGKRKFIFKRTN